MLLNSKASFQFYILDFRLYRPKIHLLSAFSDECFAIIILDVKNALADVHNITRVYFFAVSTIGTHLTLVQKRKVCGVYFCKQNQEWFAEKGSTSMAIRGLTRILSHSR